MSGMRTLRLKYAAVLKARVGWDGLTSAEFQDTGPLLVTGTDFRAGRVSWDDCHHVSMDRYAVDPHIQLRRHDLLVTKDGTVGKLALLTEPPPGPATLNSGVFVVRPRRSDLEPGYLYWVFESNLLREFIRDLAHGSTIQHLYQSDFGEFPVPLPSAMEQRRIVDFLDRKTAVIDELIADKERLLVLLAEKRQALITQLVTRGLEHSAATRESRIDWIGRVPAHWREVRLAYVGRISNGTTPDRDDPQYWEGGSVPWLSSGQVNDYEISEAREFVTDSAVRETSLRLLPAGTIVLGMIGQGRTRGIAAITKLAATINQNTGAIEPGPGLHARFLLHVLTAAYEPLREFGRGGQQDALNCEIIGQFRIPLPPIEEQRAIALELDCFVRRTRTISDRIESTIDRLREYRQALITAAVSGQLDLTADRPGYCSASDAAPAFPGFAR